MSKEELRDDQGNIYSKNWSGQWVQKQGVFGPAKDTSGLWNKTKEKDWLGNTVSTGDGKELYRKSDWNKQQDVRSGGGNWSSGASWGGGSESWGHGGSSGGGGGGGEAFGGLIGGLLFIVFGLVFWVIKLTFKGFQSLFRGEIWKALLYWIIPVIAYFYLGVGFNKYLIWKQNIEITRQEVINNQQILDDKLDQIASNPESFLEFTRAEGHVDRQLVPNCEENITICNSYYFGSYFIKQKIPGKYNLTVTGCKQLPYLSSFDAVINAGETLKIYCREELIKDGGLWQYTIPCLQIMALDDHDLGDKSIKICAKNVPVQLLFTPTPVHNITAALAKTATPTPSSRNSIYVTVVFSSVSLRSGPGVDFDVKSYAYQGDQLTIFGRSSRGNWLSLDTKGEVWVSATVVEINGDVMSLPVLPKSPE